MSDLLILGITGTIGAGKGTIVEYLVSKMGFLHYSVRKYLIEVIKQKGLTVNRDSMVLVANELRARYNPAFIIEELYKKALINHKDSIIESIRTPGEVESLRQKPNFWLLAVDAPPLIRYQRIVNRASETDHISYDEFMANEKREMESDEPHKQNITKCIKSANFILNNDQTQLGLYKQIDSIINQIKKQ